MTGQQCMFLVLQILVNGQIPETKIYMSFLNGKTEKLSLIFSHIQFFEIFVFFSLFLLLLLAKKPLPKLVLGLAIIFNCINSGLRGKKLKSFCSENFLLIFFSVSQLLRLFLFLTGDLQLNWSSEVVLSISLIFLDCFLLCL